MTTEPGEAKLLLTVDEAGARLGFGRRTVYNMIRRGELATISVGRYRRIPVAALEAWIAHLIEDQTS